VYFRDTNKTMSINENYIVYDHGALDKMIHTIVQYSPPGQLFPRVVCDQWTVDFIHSYFAPHGDEDERAPETIEMCYSFHECTVMEQTHRHVMVVLSTHHKLYFYHTNYSYWMCDDEDENVKFLEKIPGLEEPVPVNQEWKIHIRIASADDPRAYPGIEIRDKPTGGKAQKVKEGKLVFQAYFSTYIVCQTFWQGIREARVLSTGKTPTQATMSDILA